MGVKALHKSHFSSSLCNLCVSRVFINHRDTENTEVAQRDLKEGFLVQSRKKN